jgi:hypothetical protein
VGSGKLVAAPGGEGEDQGTGLDKVGSLEQAKRPEKIRKIRWLQPFLIEKRWGRGEETVTTRRARLGLRFGKEKKKADDGSIEAWGKGRIGL